MLHGGGSLSESLSKLNEQRRPEDGIWISGAREHNLKQISLLIPRNKITVVTGLSGSGKSSLAFDTIYAEGQRRYIESLSSYARYFVSQMKKPQVDNIVGLSPAIAIDQKSISPNPRSTVGTVTEIYDYLRLLFARVGRPMCPQHKIKVESQSTQQIKDILFSLPKGTALTILSPMAQGKKGEFLAEFQAWLKKGFSRARVDGQWIELDKAKKLSKTKPHNIDLLIDRLPNDEKFSRRIGESLNTAFTLSQGTVVIETPDGKRRLFSIHSACPLCGFSFPPLEPRFFSFNNPRGACPTCSGLGFLGGDEEEVQVLDDDENEVTETFEVCPDCEGRRLKPEALNVFVGEKNIAEYSALSARDLLTELRSFSWSDRDELVARKIIEQLVDRLSYMVRVGGGYLSMDRPVRTLSGGEAQRIRLAAQMGSSLIGVLYVLDEPSIGLHPRDHQRLLEILVEMRDRGNTVLMVEHDEDTIRIADHIIDMGPGAGVVGGALLAEGSLSQILASPESLTGQYLSGKKIIPYRKERRKGNGQVLKLKEATGHNLNKVNLELPLGTLIGVTGVSGSGKSTLIIETLFRALAEKLRGFQTGPAPFRSLEGAEHLDKVIEINQKPIGRTPRSTPATYTGLFPLVRDLFAGLPDAKLRGFKPGYFSFNVKGGRCETCQGMGQVNVEMHFLSDVFVTCETCQGRRYNREILNIRFRDRSIADVLELSVGEALPFFKNQTQIHRKLLTLNQVGLDYMRLGQSSVTLSGGEAQRIKLSRELSKRSTGRTIYILDEPTTGLHFADIEKLLELLHALVDQGNTVVVIEHNMDVIKNCDYVVDMGPEAGDQGGRIVARGTPEQVMLSRDSLTAPFLRSALS